MLGLLQLLRFAEMHKNIVIKIHRLSRSATNSFPLAVTSFNFSLATMKALRSGILSKLCDQSKSVLDVAQSYFMGLFIDFFTAWRMEKFLDEVDSIRNFVRFKETVVDVAAKSPSSCIFRLESFTRRMQGQEEKEAEAAASRRSEDFLSAFD